MRRAETRRRRHTCSVHRRGNLLERWTLLRSRIGDREPYWGHSPTGDPNRDQSVSDHNRDISITRGDLQAPPYLLSVDNCVQRF